MCRQHNCSAVSVLRQPAASRDAWCRAALRQRHPVPHDVTVVARTAAHRPHAVTPAHAAQLPVKLTSANSIQYKQRTIAFLVHVHVRVHTSTCTRIARVHCAYYMYQYVYMYVMSHPNTHVHTCACTCVREMLELLHGAIKDVINYMNSISMFLTLSAIMLIMHECCTCTHMQQITVRIVLCAVRVNTRVDWVCSFQLHNQHTMFSHVVCNAAENPLVIIGRCLL